MFWHVDRLMPMLVSDEGCNEWLWAIELAD